MKKIALITGATSGIGEATARKLAVDFWLVLCGRNQEKLLHLSNELSKQTKIIPLNFDVRDKYAVFSAIESLPKNWKSVDVLINNAGNAHGLDPIDRGTVEDWDAMIDGNVKGLLYVSKAVIPQMINRKSGHIINISSTAGKQTYANGTVYCASKSAVEEISKGMRLDIGKYGIKITNLAPGAVETDFSKIRFKGDLQRANKVYEGFNALAAEDIANAICFILSTPKHMLISDITITPTAQIDATTFVRNG